jgi:phenylalanyl-tRNA synthetase beta chain
MHVFDADTVQDIICRFAREGEVLDALDGKPITLTNDDLVIADSSKPIALAGIMGGKSTSVTSSTKNIFVECASFDGAMIRKSAARHKMRTESSARFEKGIQTPGGLTRFLELLIRADLCDGDDAITIVKTGVLGKHAVIPIVISHEFIEQRIGMSISCDFIEETLGRLGYQVIENEGTYTLHPPSDRFMKDLSIKEDVVEDIARFFGYDRIMQRLPIMPQRPVDLAQSNKEDLIKSVMAFGLSMREVYNHALYDEDFLRQLNVELGVTLDVLDPVSENWRRLVTSLVPHLLKAVVHNSDHHDTLRFFECGRVWRTLTQQDEKAETDSAIQPFFTHRSGSTDVNEYKMLSAIMFDKKSPITFYQGKQFLCQLFDALKLQVTYEKFSTTPAPWYAPYQTATIKANNAVIGTLGVLNAPFIEHLVQGHGIIIELDANFLYTYAPGTVRYRPAPKYPDVVRDVSMLIAYTKTAEEIAALMRAVDAMIRDVTLVDFFQKEEWLHERSLTYRITLQDEHKTLTTQEVDDVMHKVTGVLVACGAVIR